MAEFIGLVSPAAKDILGRWRARGDEWSRMRVQVDGASLAAEVIRDLESLAASEPLVSLSVAAARSGYSVDHFSRLVRKGALPNHGKKGSPRLKLSECPRKAKLATGTRQAYDPVADARSLGARR